MTPRLAVHLSTHQLPELQRAARALLRTPLITASSDADFRLVRKWESVLRNEFGQKLAQGYPLKRSCPGQAALHGRVTGERSRLGGWPVPPGVDGGFFAGVGVAMRSW
jgi:hypothetical protein